jgi:dipeptidase
MYSSNIFDVAKRQNIFTEINGQLDFLKTFAPPRAHSAYATRRVWRVFNLAAPSVNIPPFTDAYGSDYPFSVKVDKQLTPQNLMDFNRDHYEGTQFDLTKGIAAGPYGDPNRFDMAAQPADNLTIIDILQGSYERSISLFRTSYSFVACARNVPDIFAFIWFSQYAPSSSTYAPIYIASEIIPLSYTR